MKLANETRQPSREHRGPVIADNCCDQDFTINEVPTLCKDSAIDRCIVLEDEALATFHIDSVGIEGGDPMPVEHTNCRDFMCTVGPGGRDECKPCG